MSTRVNRSIKATAIKYLEILNRQIEQCESCNKDLVNEIYLFIDRYHEKKINSKKNKLI